MKYLAALAVTVMIFCVLPTTASADMGLLTETRDDEIIVGVKYTSGYFTEFLWGLSRPFHFYNTQRYHQSLEYRTPDEIYYENEHKEKERLKAG